MRPRQRVSSGGRWEPVVGYSRAVRVGDVAWVSGCTAAGPDGAVVGRGDAYAQTVQAIHTIAEALGRLGLSLDHVVKTGVYLADMGEWEAVARAHREAFGAVRPACTWVECGTMIHPDMLVEIDAIAVN
ncbi:MAG TPA: RidA family protein [Methylomirabilota bacterium]|jgi:enamine deaminase RidA (YjgF/YER057c/UK114 family)|nr:RidA family protein [Methylomirabilota bacterium]